MSAPARALAAVLLLAALADIVGHGQAPPAQPRALILFDGTTLRRPEGVIDAAHVANLMGHFGFRPVSMAIEDYKPGGMAPFDAVFVVGGAETTAWPATVLNDVRQRTRSTVWIGFGVDALLAGGEAARRGVRVDEVVLESRYDRVRYRGVTVGKGETMLVEMTLLDPALARVEAATLDPEGRERPYIVRSGPLWIVADVPFAYITDHDRYFVFCDALHDMLGVTHEPSRRALIRVEDVNPQDDPDMLRRAVGVFIDEGIPFQIGLVPIYRDQAADRDVYLSDRPDLVAVLHEAVARGGTIVLHGSTHQYRGATPDDFEFWDRVADRPRADDSPELVRRKIGAALDECFRNDLYPIAWETPHYTASPLDYAEVSRVFSTIYERPMITAERGTQQTYPFPTTDTRGFLVIPEDLGYLPMDNPSPAALIENARALTVVRDGIASAYVHNFIDTRFLRETVRGIKALGYRFVSLREFPCRVSTGNRLIATRGASPAITLQDEHLRQFIVGEDGRRRDERWSGSPQSGATSADLVPGPRDILVAVGTAGSRPAPPGPVARLGQSISAMLGSLRQRSPLARPAPDLLAAAIVWREGASGADANDQASFANLFRAYGIRLRFVPAAEVRASALASNEVLLVPNVSANALATAGVDAVVEFVRGGGSLVTDGRSPLAERLGIRYIGQTVTALTVRDTAAPDLPMRWRPAAVIDDFRLPPGATALSADTATGTITAAAFARRGGRVIYLSTLLDPFTPDATSRFPFLFEHVLASFDRALPARRPSVELYFDPGLRQGVSIEDLAASWRRLGVRAIYAAAWEFRSSYTYDYDRLIRVCHANGILVYAWFELPQVSPRFWQEHPEWREVPAAGVKLPSWRQAMNLENPACRAAALKFMTEVVHRWPWDGVNLAELNFDGEANGDMPEQLVPMNADVRAAFTAQHRFDPRELFTQASPHFWKRDQAGWRAFLAMRRAIVLRWHREFLAALRPFAAQGREVVLTALDSLEYPAVTANTGVDTTDIIALAREFPFTLQVEDPATAWTDPPTRYRRLAERYRAIAPASLQVMFDINVVPDRRVDATHLPLEPAVGAELAASVRAARTLSPRVAIYGDATIRERDLELLAYAAAGGAEVSAREFSWSVDTPEAIELAVPVDLHDFYLGGGDWPCWRPGFVLLPAGRHVVSAYRPWFRLFDLSSLRPQLMQVSARLVAGGAARGQLAFEYDDRSPVVARLGLRPVRVTVDGTPLASVETVRGIGTILTLPAGRHRVVAVDSGRAAILLDVVSVVSSSLIVAFGTFASATLLGLFAWIRIRRWFRSS